MDATLSVAAISSSLSYSSKSVQVKTAGGYAKVQEESLSLSVRADSVTLGASQSLGDPKSKVVDLKALLASGAEDAKKSNSGSLDLTELQKKMKDQLVEQMKQAQAALKSAGQDSKLIDDILYAVDKDQKAAQVPDEWGADQTSQRIVDFAAAFKGSAKGMSDEDFVAAIRKSIQDGFRSAKGDLKDLPGPSAKLFNDTYEATMKKLDDLLASWQKEAQGGTGADGTTDVRDASSEMTDSGKQIPDSVASGKVQPAPSPVLSTLVPVTTPGSGSKPASTFTLLA